MFYLAARHKAARSPPGIGEGRTGVCCRIVSPTAVPIVLQVRPWNRGSLAQFMKVPKRMPSWH
jgi:hypothetical protein